MGVLLHFPTFTTQAESHFGFSLKPSPTGGYVVVAELRDGLLAVKARASDGSIHYRVCNRAYAELYATAATLEELSARFRSDRAETTLGETGR